MLNELIKIIKKAIISILKNKYLTNLKKNKTNFILTFLNMNKIIAYLKIIQMNNCIKILIREIKLENLNSNNKKI